MHNPYLCLKGHTLQHVMWFRVHYRHTHTCSITSVSCPSQEKSTLDSPNLEDEMGLTGAAADDIETELMRKVCETEVGGAAGMLACFEPLIVAVVTNPSNYPCPALQASAALALAKFMLIRYGDLVRAFIDFSLLLHKLNGGFC